jgi:uracil-DNA glycosylase
LKAFLKKEMQTAKIFPPGMLLIHASDTSEKEIYSWSQHTPLDRVKVVILGQDPYHNVNQAHGLCFSVRPPTPAPPSLKNIFKCLKIDYPNFTEPKTGYILRDSSDTDF